MVILTINRQSEPSEFITQGPLTRHTPAIKPARKAAGYRHAWWLKFGRIDRLEGAILGVSAEISQISDAPGPDGVVNLFLYLVE